MDWADDTAYSLNDLVDGINVSFITTERIERWAATQSLSKAQSAHVDNLLDAIRDERTEPVIGRKIGEFIAACHLEEVDESALSKPWVLQRGARTARWL